MDIRASLGGARAVPREAASSSRLSLLPYHSSSLLLSSKLAYSSQSLAVGSPALPSFTFDSTRHSPSPNRSRMNSDAALSALEIARRHYSSDNYSSALRFCKKSIALHSTPEAVALLARIEKADAAAQTSGTSSATSNPPSNSTTSARPTPRASTSKPAPPREEKAREYTPAQLALVKRVKACRVTQYYEILAIEKGCSDSDVKKAYRKVSF